MIYTPFSLNGTWQMKYQEDKYTSFESPFENMHVEEDAAGTEPEDISNDIIQNAVPGYWEDMTEAFRFASFFSKLKINPEYGIQSYPIAGNAPDMALPNIVGNFFYRRSFVCENIDAPSVLHFEGVQNSVAVWINDIFLERHEGYSTPFDIKIPSGVLKVGENTVVLSVSNHRLEGYAGEPVSGLTSRAANECTGGITGNLELRVYNCPLRDVAILISEDCTEAFVKVDMAESTAFTWSICDGDEILKNGESSGDFSFDTEGLDYWSPENPKLYTLKIKCGEGEYTCFFGVRRLIADGVHFKLNNNPYYLRGICEHCYFPETIHPNHDYTYYRSIIKKVKSLGFNFIRFHTYIPEEEYMQAADELGILLHVECPNNTTVAEWEKIVEFCRRHTSVVIYCCGNELLIDEPFIEYLNKCADSVHENTDALFSPMNALRGLEYFWVEPEQEKEIKAEPLKHHPRRIKAVGEFSDMYSTYTNGQHSYFSLSADPHKVDGWSSVYGKPRVSHEICIDGTYTDLSLKDRYKGLRVGNTDMFNSIERHLEEKGVLSKAALYFKNSSQWQRRMRKYCFEAMRRSNNMAGYDFLGPIDTHWHTFGYDVGMMNEFYELKPGETLRNVLMYNSPTVILTDLGKKANFVSEGTINCNILVSHYGESDLLNAQLGIKLSVDGKIVERQNVHIEAVKNGEVSVIHRFSVALPRVEKPAEMKLYVTLDKDEVFAENEWELYLFPEPVGKVNNKLVVSSGMESEELMRLLESGKDVLLLGAEPFTSLPTSFRIALAGRTSGNLATVIADHPALRNMPHGGFCGWQFIDMLENGSAVCFECDDVVFNPIIEVVSTHKYVIRQAAMFEFNAINGRLLVCGFKFNENDPAANWLKSQLISYASSDEFNPKDNVDRHQLISFINSAVKKAASNTNLAFNPNDKTAIRKK